MKCVIFKQYFFNPFYSASYQSLKEVLNMFSSKLVSARKIKKKMENFSDTRCSKNRAILYNPLLLFHTDERKPFKHTPALKFYFQYLTIAGKKCTC